jgi:hypothetical protein
MKSQCQLVLNHLIDHGYVTEVIARSYGVRRLASRIHDLKKIGGIPVKRDMRTDDLDVPYAYYYLTDADREDERRIRANGDDWNLRPLAKAA